MIFGVLLGSRDYFYSGRVWFSWLSELDFLKIFLIVYSSTIRNRTEISGLYGVFERNRAKYTAKKY